jgi:hypothetical protein
LVFHCLQKEYKAVKYDKCARLHSSCSAHTCVVCGVTVTLRDVVARWLWPRDWPNGTLRWWCGAARSSP